MTNKEKIEKALALAEEVMKLARNTLVVNLRFMDSAISRLTWLPVPGLIGTDGEFFYYDPFLLLQIYAQESEQAAHLFLHTVMHCVFRHYVTNHMMIDRELWDLACDMAVEASIIPLHVQSVHVKATRNCIMELNKIKQGAGMLTAEKIYAYLRDHPQRAVDLVHWKQLFASDMHAAWYMTGSERILLQGKAIGRTQQNGGQNQGGEGQNGSDRNGEGQQAANAAAIEAMWKDISEKMGLDLESFSKRRGDQAGDLMQNLREVNREKYDYTEFLKKFSVMGEVMKINDDEFDYIFYTYGMQLFPDKRLPLIEPLEYKEVNRIREFVIAIDTSGSVIGDEVQAFVTKTYNILKSTESFFSKINLHILQCDAEVQEHVKITTQEEFDQYLKNMKLKGFGGTDFRPVFDLTDRFIREHEFTNLKGLIYFTDGYGTFPARKPDYLTAFVFVNDEYENPEVPPWAVKLVLQKGDLQAEKKA